MKKLILLFGILGISMMSTSSFASYQTAVCKGNFYINDPYYQAGVDNYDVYVEVISAYPTDGVGVIFTAFSPANQWIPFPSTPAVTVANVWYQSPVSYDYYIMRVWAKKNTGSNQWRRSNDSYASFTLIGGVYYMVAVDDFTVSAS